MKKKAVSLLLAFVLTLGLAVPALAAGQTFSDVPSSYWGYADIEAVAKAGLMNGTGGGAFSPEMKVSVAQFLTLLGRLVFPDVKAEGADWFGPYVTAAKDAGLLNGTQVDVNNTEAEISRYDMTVILRAAAKKLGVAEKSAQSSEVADYMDIPTRYADSVLAVYGMGLIKGDQAGNFNGSNTMMRAEVATVIMRLAKAKPGGTTTEPEQPEQPTETPPPAEPKYVNSRVVGWLQYNSKGDPQKNGIGVVGVPMELRYTEDNGATYTVIAEVLSTDGDGYQGLGWFEFKAKIEQTIYDRYQDGKGQFYFSAETVVNGQRYVTHDRRTDGKATIAPITNWTRAFVDLVPPDRGETVEVKVYGHVIAQTAGYDSEGHLWLHSHSDTITNSTVRVYYDRQQEGVAPVLLWETNADGGVIDDIMTNDTAYYYTTGNCYVVEIEAVLDGQLCTDHRGQQKPISLDELSGTYPSTIIWRYIHSDQAFAL